MTLPEKPPRRGSRAAALALLALLAPRAVPAAEERAPHAPAPAPIRLRIQQFAGPEANVIPPRHPPTTVERARRAQFDLFEAIHPEIKFEPMQGLHIGGGWRDAQLLMAMAGNTAGEILNTNFRAMNTFVRQGFFYPLDEYVIPLANQHRARKGLLPVQDVTQIQPEDLDVAAALWPPLLQRGPPDGRVHFYCMPGRLQAIALQYNRAIFHDLGLEHPPRDWNELYEFADRATNPDEGVLGLGIDQHGWHFSNFVYQAGGRLVMEAQADAQGNPARDAKGEYLPAPPRAHTDVWVATFDSPAAVKAARFWRKLITRKKTSPRTGRSSKIAGGDIGRAQMFSQGKCAMLVGSVNDQNLAGGLRQMAQELIGIAAMPRDPEAKETKNEINTGLVGINAQVTDKRVRDAAWAWLLFERTDEPPLRGDGRPAVQPDGKPYPLAIQVYVDVFVREGQARLLTPQLLDKCGYRDYATLQDPEWVAANREALENGVPEPYGRNCQNIYKFVWGALEKLVNDPAAEAKAGLRPGTPGYDRDTREIQAILSEYCRKTNEQLLGRIEPARLKRVTTIVWGIVAAIALVFAWAVRRMVGIFRTMQFKQGYFAGTKGRAHLYAWLFMGAALLSIAVWSYVPLARGAVMAFREVRIIGDSRWVGLDNFIRVLLQEEFRQSFVNSFVYVALALGMGFFVPVVLALMLSEIPRGQMFYRTLFYLPAVITGLVMTLLWRRFFEPTPEGFLNQILALFGQPPKRWLEDPNGPLGIPLAMFCIILPGIWAHAGPGCIIYLAALKSIPEELYEAADLDGCGALHKIWHITLPTLKPLIIINLVAAFIGAFHAAQNILVMTQGGPEGKTHVLGLYIFEQAFVFLNFGMATAVAWILGAMLIGFTIYQLKILRDVRFSTAK